jgi:hypothetical protein
VGEAVESPEVPNGGLGTVAIVSIAALATAWCAFQSSLWGGRQTFALLDATADNVRATERHLEGNQLFLLDATMFMAWDGASLRGEDAVAASHAARFRPELRAAFAAWRAHRGPDAPPTPFGEPEYLVMARVHGDDLALRARAAAERAMTFNRTSDTYVLMTVLFSTVTVLAGLAEKLRHPRARRWLFLFTVAMLAAAVVAVATLPVTWVG